MYLDLSFCDLHFLRIQHFCKYELLFSFTEGQNSVCVCVRACVWALTCEEKADVLMEVKFKGQINWNKSLGRNRAFSWLKIIFICLLIDYIPK
jgi:hypothetical protein